MDIASLASLGKIAGLGGLAIGLVALLIRPLIDQMSNVPRSKREPTLRFIATGAFGIADAAISRPAFRRSRPVPSIS
jgi:hypothetical protein